MTYMASGSPCLLSHGIIPPGFLMGVFNNGKATGNVLHCNHLMS